MSRLSELMEKLCPDGVEFVPLWSVTIWDKKFNAVERYKQPVVDSYQYLLANDLFLMEDDCRDVFLLSTGEKTGWTTEAVAGDYLKEGEVVSIPWGKSRAVTDCIKYYKGKFVTADNRIATSSNTEVLSNKYLYYWMMSQGQIIDSFYRGSGIKHPDMAKVLDMQIPVPPLPIQNEIVKLLDNFTELTAELTAELMLRKKQYEYYRASLLSFEKEQVERVKIESICLIQRGRVMSKGDIAENKGDYPIYSSQTENNGELGRISSFDFEGEYLTWTTDGANAGTVFYRDGKFSITNVCGLLKVKPDTLLTKYLYYALSIEAPKYVNSGMGNPKLMSNAMACVKIPLPLLERQKEIVSILDRFDTLCNDLSQGLPAEIAARKKQYEYYRDKLLTFPRKAV